MRPRVGPQTSALRRLILERGSSSVQETAAGILAASRETRPLISNNLSLGLEAGASGRAPHGLGSSLSQEILRRVSPGLEFNCTCWTLKQTYQMIPKPKLG
ncbi:UDP-GalNAc:beta-1,3-N-acetylgalactosaminyltransferase 1 isoform X3 [Rhea pennata]|uniref:UDP-GalNAc:beta-1, 3-N-acetylgalactosaminyltransferase 1 isoform X3 n=1 Tax=Rhea pennata TaxID=8795 RepID=UPI002E272BBD